MLKYYFRYMGLNKMCSCFSFFYVCACMLSHFSRVQLFVTPRNVARQAPLSMGFSRQEYWCGVPCPLPGDLPDMSPVSPALQVDALSLCHLRSPFLRDFYFFPLFNVAKRIKNHIYGLYCISYWMVL